MSRVLVAHASRRGRTRRITEQLAERLRWRGHEVEVACAREGRLPPSEDYDAVILGSRIAWGHHAREILEYVREHRDDLDHKPSAFFSVNFAAALPFAGRDPRGHLRHTFEELSWTPDHAASFGRIGTPPVAGLADLFAISLPDSAPLSECSPAYGPMG